MVQRMHFRPCSALRDCHCVDRNFLFLTGLCLQYAPFCSHMQAGLPDRHGRKRQESATRLLATKSAVGSNRGCFCCLLASAKRARFGVGSREGLGTSKGYLLLAKYSEYSLMNGRKSHFFVSCNARSRYGLLGLPSGSVAYRGG